MEKYFVVDSAALTNTNTACSRIVTPLTHFLEIKKERNENSALVGFHPPLLDSCDTERPLIFALSL